MKQDVRTPFDRALDRVRRAAYPEGEFVGQESFLSASEVRRLGVYAGIGPGAAVLDLCCGVGGPGRLLAAELGCDYLGVDASADAVALARERAGGLSCRFELGTVPPLPEGRFDVVLLLETLLAFPEKGELVRAVAAALPPGGRFALTVEEGRPLSARERAAMPDADTVWPVPLTGLVALLEDAGLRVRWLEDWSAAHRATAEGLLRALLAERTSLTAELGTQAVDDLVALHALWIEWLGSGRARKLACVAEKATAL